MRMIPILGVMILALSGCQNRTTSEQTARSAQLEKENASLRADLERRGREAPPPAPAPPKAAEPPRMVPEKPAAPSHHPDDLAAIQQFRTQAVESRATVAELQARVEKLDAQVLNMMADRKRLSEAEAESAGKLEIASRSVEALQRDAKAAADRTAQAESQIRKLRDETSAQTQRAGQIGRTVAELEDIDRRREILASSLARRYREVMEQYRNLSATIENRRSSDAAAVGSLDLSRIQQAVSLAEDDLRQLTALNAQASRVQKKLAAAK
jgi:DNA repair exonuclease SbcCD ATPase subunit